MKKINWTSLKLKTFALQKATSGKLEDNPQTGRKYQQKNLIKDIHLSKTQRSLNT